MRHPRARRTRAGLALAAALLLLAPACGDKGSGRAGDPSGNTATGLGDGAWLVGITATGGSDAEQTDTTYVTFDPSTGKTHKVALPAVTAASSDPALTPLLVSGDRHWAIPDLEIPRAGEKTGQVKVYALTDGSALTLDLHKLADRDMSPIAWAFDPREPETLHLVDADYKVWSLDLAGGKPQQARQYDALKASGTVFTNAFDPNTAEPYVESLDGTRTYPDDMAGRLRADIRREGGTLLPTESAQLRELPKNPCELASGFRTDDGESWLICADQTRLRAYTLAKGASTWRPYGRESPEVALEIASMTVVLPPA